MVDDVRLPAAAPPSRVALFITCFNDTMFPQTGRAVVTVLERLGVGVDFPLEQTCCGQMHFNTGYAQETQLLRTHMGRLRDKLEAQGIPRKAIETLTGVGYRLRAADTVQP